MIEINTFNISFFKYLPIKKIRNVLLKTLEGEAIEHAEINVVLSDVDTIKDLNRKYLNHDYAADVLAFPFEENPLTGDIYICVEQAGHQAEEYGVSLRNELIRLAVHGALHLIGYRDDSDKEKEKMFDKQEKYVRTVI